MTNLDGKNALVTGATGGIGAEIVKHLHARGASVIITGRRKDVLDDMASELGDRIYPLVADISDKTDVESLIDKANECIDGVDILVCNAGITKDNLVLRMKDDEWSHVIETNLTSTYCLNKAVLRKMFKRRWGRIINITSVVGVTGNPGQANYAASKAGIIGMSKSIALEVASRGITVNCVAPGFIATPMTDGLTDEQKAKILETIPQGHLGEPDDIAQSVGYLVSDGARYVTGQTIHVNGGMVMV